MKHGIQLRVIGLREISKIRRSQSKKRRNKTTLRRTNKKSNIILNRCIDCDTKFWLGYDSCPNCYGENIKFGGRKENI